MRVIDTAKELRKEDPGLGGKKLWLMQKSMFKEDWVPGRDSFLRLLDTEGMTLPKPKPRRTTNSNHRFRKYRNLIKGLVPTAANQLWVSDITYIDTLDDFSYLHLVTDAYSHKIIGYCLSESIEARHSLTALKMAIDSTGNSNLEGLIHHSDRGVQYCSNDYVKELKDHNIMISMTEDSNPTDNAIAERINGIIKTEFVYRKKHFKNVAEAREQIYRFIHFYNERRPHSSIGMKVPSKVHSESGTQDRLW